MADTSDDAVPSAPDGKRWYTVEEAGEYLGVSRPTIFRWMKDGQLSFYKIGGATRFSREGLDAVIEKNVGQKEAEAAAGRCLACGNSNLVDGRMQSTGLVYFHPDHARFWSLEISMVGTRAKMCAACGYVHMYADTEKLHRLLEEEEPDA